MSIYRVTASADGVRQEHAVEPRVNDAIARAERDAAAVADEVRQRRMRYNVHRLGVSRSVAEGLSNILQVLSLLALPVQKKC